MSKEMPDVSDKKVFYHTLVDMMDDMKAAGIRLPDLDDLWDVRRALVEFRDRMASDYEHSVHMGKLDIDKAAHPEFLEELAKQNPLPESSRDALLAYLQTGEEAPELERAFDQIRSGVNKQALTPDVVNAIFPREGKPQESWTPSRRLPEALEHYDLVYGVDSPSIPEDFNPEDTERSLDLIMASAGVSLREAKRVLKEMRRSVEPRKGPQGGRIALQPSSAMCKLYRQRRLTTYKPPRSLFDTVGSHAVVILVSPDGAEPRVMTWRRGAHVDCDMTAKTTSEIPSLIGRAIQMALFWTAEKESRMPNTRIYLGKVGDRTLQLIWEPTEDLSLETVQKNLKANNTVTYQTQNQAEKDKKRYLEGVEKLFGYKKKAQKSKRRGRKPRSDRSERVLKTGKPSKTKGPKLVDLRRMAKEAGIKGYSRMRKAQLQAALAEEREPTPVEEEEEVVGFEELDLPPELLEEDEFELPVRSTPRLPGATSKAEDSLMKTVLGNIPGVSLEEDE